MRLDMTQIKFATAFVWSGFSIGFEELGDGERIISVHSDRMLFDPDRTAERRGRPRG
jgi:hypothetical protein